MVAKTVLVLLLIMSAGSWYILVVKLLEQAKMAKQARAAQAFWSAKTVAEGTQALDADSPFRFLADAAHNAVQKHDGLMLEDHAQFKELERRLKRADISWQVVPQYECRVRKALRAIRIFEPHTAAILEFYVRSEDTRQI